MKEYKAFNLFDTPATISCELIYNLEPQTRPRLLEQAVACIVGVVLPFVVYQYITHFLQLNRSAVQSSYNGAIFLDRVLVNPCAA